MKKLRAWQLMRVAGLGLALLGLSACGGGGSGGSSGGGSVVPPNPALPDTVVKAASAAKLRSNSLPSAGKGELRWEDWLDVETGFQIERKVNGAWQTVATVPAGAGQGAVMSWSGPLETAQTPYRVVAMLSQGLTVALGTDRLKTEVVLGQPPAAAGILLGAAEPLQGTVKLHLGGVEGLLAVQYFIDGKATTDVEVDSSVTSLARWDTVPIANGSHTIRATVEFAPSSFVELQRTVTTRNPDLILSFAISGGTVTARIINRIGVPLPGMGLQVDGKEAVPPLPGPNTTVCPPGKECFPAYVFHVPMESYDYGAHMLTVTTQGLAGGRELSQSQSSFFDSPPVITLDSLLSGTLVNDVVQVSGFASDDSGRLSGEVTFHRESMGFFHSGRFQFEKNVAGWTPGLYELKVRASDGQSSEVVVTRDILVQPTTADRIEPVLNLRGDVLARKADRFLVRENGKIISRAYGDSGSDVILQVDDPSRIRRWYSDQYDDWGNRGIYWFGADGEDTLLWKTDGSQVRLRNYYSHDAAYASGFTAAGTLVAWIESNYLPAQYWLRTLDLRTMSAVSIPLPPGYQWPANSNFAGRLTVSPDGKHVVLTASRLDGSSTGETEDVMLAFEVVTRSVRILSGAIQDYPSTDGQIVTWLQKVSDSPVVGWELWMAPVDGSAKPVRLSTEMYPRVQANRVHVGGGWVGWYERWGDRRLYRNGQWRTLGKQGISLTTLTQNSIVYQQDGKTVIWTPAGGARILLHADASFAWAFDGVYFCPVRDQLYRVTPALP